jgi:metal-sulfur cluster biosynthetic enzyme
MSETSAANVPDDETLFDLEEAMRDVVDPELGINVVDLGLVYGLSIEQNEDGTVALIDMTLTSAACPLTDVIEDQSRSA